MPLDLSRNAVPRDAGLIMHNGDAFARNAIKQSGLADIWTANNGNETWHNLKSKASCHY
jgi:hypothetical protein